MKQRRAFNQPDLLRTHRPNRQLHISEQIGLISLVGSLLIEALSGNTAVMIENEGSDEQDHG
jgi:hypothetical protein